MQDDVEIVARALIVPLGHDPNADWARVYVGNGFEADGSLKALCLALADAAMTAARTIDAAALQAECSRRGVSAHWPANWLTQRAKEKSNG